jgi:hypothetical protein
VRETGQNVARLHLHVSGLYSLKLPCQSQSVRITVSKLSLLSSYPAANGDPSIAHSFHSKPSNLSAHVIVSTSALPYHGNLS